MTPTICGFGIEICGLSRCWGIERIFHEGPESIIGFVIFIEHSGKGCAIG